MTSLSQRVLRVAAAGVVLAMSVTGSAEASGPDLAAAGEAAHSTEAARLIDKAAANAVQRSSKAVERAAVVVQQDVVPVYALSPEFVSRRSAEVASLWYVATTATKGSTTLTVFTAPDQSTGKWAAVNVASGNTEARMAAAARGARLFTEPQIGAWYALAKGRIRALNPTAIEAIGTKAITVEDYRQRVTARYADKQAGSAYDKNGAAGGYDVNPAATEATALPLTVGAAAAVLLAAGVVLYRRRRTHA